ncbi:MAG: hypothetical protein ABI862_07705 [Ilumatobacteraceae bacterium]
MHNVYTFSIVLVAVSGAPGLCRSEPANDDQIGGTSSVLVQDGFERLTFGFDRPIGHVRVARQAGGVSQYSFTIRYGLVDEDGNELGSLHLHLVDGEDDPSGHHGSPHSVHSQPGSDGLLAFGFIEPDIECAEQLVHLRDETFGDRPSTPASLGHLVVDPR